MPKHSVTEEIDEMARELTRHLESLTREFIGSQRSAELGRSETALLHYLDEHGPSTMSDISAGLRLALSSTTGVVDALVRRKLVDRERPQEDRRTVVVALTSAGRHAYGRFVDDRVRLALGMLEPLTASERKLLVQLFRKITGRGRPARR